MAPIDAIWLFALLMELPLCGSSPLSTLHACDIGVASKNYLKWRAIQLVIHLIIGV